MFISHQFPLDGNHPFDIADMQTRLYPQVRVYQHRISQLRTPIEYLNKTIESYQRMKLHRNLDPNQGGRFAELTISVKPLLKTLRKALNGVRDPLPLKKYETVPYNRSNPVFNSIPTSGPISASDA